MQKPGLLTIVRTSILSLSLAPTSIYANMRAPLECNSCSGSSLIRNLDTTKAILLSSEVLKAKVELPNQTVPNSMGSTHFEIVYSLFNQDPSTTFLPIEFLAPDMINPQISLNDVALDYCLSNSLKNQIEASEKLLKSEQPKRVEMSLGPKRNTLSANLELKPGKNSVRVSYTEKLNLSEGSRGYFDGTKLGVEGAVFWFDYFLYPGLTWKKSESFKLLVEISIQDAVKEGWFWDTNLRPEVTSNLELIADKSVKKSSLNQLKGEFSEFSQDVFRVTMKIK